jgi:hypothetical protein
MGFVLASVVGCGHSEKVLHTTEVVAALRGAHFHELHVISNRKEATKLARALGKPRLAQHPVDIDFIYDGRLRDVFDATLTATRFPSIAMALQRMRADRPLLTGEVVPRPTFDRTRLTEVRVCNVVLMSYDQDDNALLKAHVDVAVAELRKRC